jgi:hypothetical protein
MVTAPIARDGCARMARAPRGGEGLPGATVVPVGAESLKSAPSRADGDRESCYDGTSGGVAPLCVYSRVREDPSEHQRMISVHGWWAARKGVGMAVKDKVPDGAARVLADTRDKVAAAQIAMRELINDDTSRPWTPRELQDAAGDMGDWSASVLSLAFWGLVDEGDLVSDENLIARVPAT